VREEDPARQRLLSIVEQWSEHLGDKRVTVAEVIAAATVIGRAEFRESLLEVAGERGSINGRRLGAYLGQHKGRRVGDRWFASGKLRQGNATWLLQGAREASNDGGTVHWLPDNATGAR
jgi:hypothetical protein